MNKILSIIIPTYNMENYLRKCLDSLIISDENMQLLEVLIVNDGSKDSSSQIAHEYEDQYPYTFRVIDKENGNYGSCINRGLKEMKGKYVKILDADDYFDTIVLDRFVSFLIDVEVDMVITDYNLIDTGGSITNTISYNINNGGKAFSFGDFLTTAADFDIEMHAITYNRNLLVRMNYHQTEGISYTDQEWSTIPIVNVKCACYYNNCLYQYLLGREGQTMLGLEDKVHLDQLFIVLLNLSKFYEDHLYEDVYDLYVKRKISLQLRYRLYIGLLKKTKLKDTDLHKYDAELKQYPRAYDIANEFRSFKNTIHYVRIWRTGNFLERYFLVILPRLLKKLYQI